MELAASLQKKMLLDMLLYARIHRHVYYIEYVSAVSVTLLCECAYRFCRCRCEVSLSSIPERWQEFER
jgi:hypothetical protein